MKVTATISLEIGDERITLKAGEPGHFDDLRSLAASSASGKYHQLDIGGFIITIDQVLVGWVYVDDRELFAKGKFVEHWALLDGYFPAPGTNQRLRTIKLEYLPNWTELQSFKDEVKRNIDIGKHVRYIRAECEHVADWPF